MRRQSYIPVLLAVQIGAVLVILSCGSKQPSEQIRVRVTPGFAGPIDLSACVPGAPATDITVNDRGEGVTSACPSRDASVELMVLRGNDTIRVVDVSVSRTGDGLATGIRAQVPR